MNPNGAPTLASDYLTRRDVAELLNCHPEYAQGLIDSRGIPMMRIGTANCITREAAQQLLPFKKTRRKAKVKAA